MNLESMITFGMLIPIIYAGLYALTDPSRFIRIVNKIVADTHRLEAGTLFGDLFAAPRAIPDSGTSRLCLRFMGLALMVLGLFRLRTL